MPVDGDVARLHFFLRHPQRHEDADDFQQDVGHDRREDDDPERGQRLPLEQLQTAAGDQAFVFAAHRHVGEDADEQAAGDTGEAVRVHDSQRVVDVAERRRAAQVVERQIHDHRGDDADDDRAPAVDETGAGRDRDEADDHPVDRSDQARLAARQVVHRDPDEEGDRGADVRVEHRGRGDFAGAVPVTAVEAVPAHPQQPGADRDHRQVVRRVDLSIALQARPDHGRGDEARDAGGEVDHVTAGVVDRAVLGEEAAAPDQEGVDRVAEQRPESDERDPRLEVDPAEHGAQHEDRRDRREDDLEVGERRLREEEFFFRQLRDVCLA